MKDSLNNRKVLLVSLACFLLSCTTSFEPMTPPEPSDKDLRKVLEYSISNHPDFAESQIQVDVTEGYVALSGKVDSSTQKEILENIVKHTGNVESLTNNVIISKNGSLPSNKE